MTDQEKAAGRAGLDAFVNPLIAAAPWYARGTIRGYLTDDLDNGMVEAVASGARAALDAFIDPIIASGPHSEAVAAYMNDDFRNRLVAAIEEPITALRNL